VVVRYAGRPTWLSHRCQWALRDDESSETAGNYPGEEGCEMSELPTFGIVTFMRPEKLRTLVSSIRGRYHYPDILIADNGRKLPARHVDMRYLPPVQSCDIRILPFDCGLSASRNFIVSQTSGDLLILDDDYEFTHETRIESMQEILREQPDVGIVCGDAGFTRPQQFNRGELVPSSNMIHATVNGVEYQICDLADNFMLVRRELFDDGIRWNPELKTGEHRDFFEKVHRHGKWKVAFCPSVRIKHNRGGDSHEYGTYRSRCSKFHREIANWNRRLSGQRIVAVIGPYRGGTSCVGGMLHKLGISLGDDFRPAKSANPMGFFESERLIKICHESFPEPKLIEQTTREWRVEQLKLWAAIRPSPAIIGAKHPNLCLMIPDMIEAWPDVRIVNVLRPMRDVENSLLDLGWGWPKESVHPAIFKMFCRRADGLEGVPHLDLPYRLCVDDPARAVSLLADFAGINPTAEQRQAAIDHVRPELCHYGRVEGNECIT